MPLVFYSGGQNSSNRLLHSAVSELTRRKKNRHFTYIPFCTEGSDIYYARAIKRYQPFGFQRFQCLSVDRNLVRDNIKRALDGDVIYLAGGNTFYFLNHLRRSGLIPKLRRFAQDGGVLAGLSAGGVILTPHIELAGYPDFDRDDNDVGVKNLKGLKMVEFEFFPHYDRSHRLQKALCGYSATSNYPVYACRDGSGIIVEDRKMTLMGEVNLFCNGDVYEMTR